MRFLLTLALLTTVTQCASEYSYQNCYDEMQRIITLKQKLRTAIEKLDTKTFMQILDEHPHLVFHTTGNAKTNVSDHSVLSQALECDNFFFIKELLKRGAPLQAYALSYHIRQVCKSVCKGSLMCTVRLQAQALGQFYDLLESAQLPEELKYSDTVFGEINTPQKYLQVIASQCIHPHLWHCNYCEKPWTKHKKKPNFEHLALLAAAVKLINTQSKQHHEH